MINSTQLIEKATTSFDGYLAEEGRSGHTLPIDAIGHFSTGFHAGYFEGRGDSRQEILDLIDKKIANATEFIDHNIFAHCVTKIGGRSELENLKKLIKLL